MNQDVPLRRAIAALLVACGLCACGGTDESEPPPASTVGATEAVAPLLDDDGQAMPSSVRPADAGAWTSNGRYASAAQAHFLARALGESLFEVEVGCCADDAVSQASGIIWALQAAQDRPNAQTKVLVSGPDERLAAATVNGLLQGGLRDVWLVTETQQ